MEAFKSWWNRVVLRKQPELVAAPEPFLGPDELAEKLAGEANDLFRTVQAKREEAAAILENAAAEAHNTAEILKQRAEAALALAKARREKAAQSSKIAASLSQFIG